MFFGIDFHVWMGPSSALKFLCLVDKNFQTCINVLLIESIVNRNVRVWLFLQVYKKHRLTPSET